MAILLQALAVRLGIGSGRDLAQACRDSYSKPTTIALWIICEIAIAACDLAEVIGAAIALNLLFGAALVGRAADGTDVFVVLYLQNKGFRYVEALVVALIVVIAARRSRSRSGGRRRIWRTSRRASCRVRRS